MSTHKCQPHPLPLPCPTRSQLLWTFPFYLLQHYKRNATNCAKRYQVSSTNVLCPQAFQIHLPAVHNHWSTTVLVIIWPYFTAECYYWTSSQRNAMVWPRYKMELFNCSSFFLLEKFQSAVVIYFILCRLLLVEGLAIPEKGKPNYYKWMRKYQNTIFLFMLFFCSSLQNPNLVWNCVVGIIAHNQSTYFGNFKCPNAEVGSQFCISKFDIDLTIFLLPLIRPILFTFTLQITMESICQCKKFFIELTSSIGMLLIRVLL